MTSPDRPPPWQLRVAVARTAYDTGMVRIADRDLAGFAHIVATRHGLFAVSPDACKPIAFGQYFGMTVRGDALYAFEACDDIRAPTRRGRIVRFHRDGDRIVDADVFATGLANGCHQIDFIHNRLCVLDTYNQRVISYPADGGTPSAVHPLGRPAQGDWDGGYVHFNSMIARGDDILVMLHNGAEHTGQPSEIAIFDRDWKPIGRASIDGLGCHNFAILEAGTLLSCGSLAGELIGSDGLKVKVCDMMTRGLSVDDNMIAVGGSAFSARERREDIAGVVYFLDRDYRPLGSVEIPGPPVEIRRIDGRDRSLSSFVQAPGTTATA